LNSMESALDERPEACEGDVIFTFCRANAIDGHDSS